MKTRSSISIGLIMTLMSACGQGGANTDATPQPKAEQSAQVRNPASQSAMPDEVNVKCKFKEVPVPFNLEDDDGNTATGLMANISQTIYSVPINDFLDLSKASSHSFISPGLGDCRLTTYSLDFVGPANEILNFAAKDSPGTSTCQSFMKSIGADGLQMQFTDVPLLNDQATIIKKVIISISNP